MNGDLLYFHLRKQDNEGEENQPRNAMVVGQLDKRDKKKKKKKLQQVCLAIAFHISLSAVLKITSKFHREIIKET